MIYASVIHGMSQNKLVHFRCISLISSHFLTFDIVFVARESRAHVYSFSIQCFKLQTKPSCWIDVGGMEGQHGVWWPVWWKGVNNTRDSCAPSLASCLLHLTYNVCMCSDLF